MKNPFALNPDVEPTPLTKMQPQKVKHKAKILINVIFSLKNKTDIIKTKIGEVYKRITATEAPLSKIV